MKERMNPLYIALWIVNVGILAGMFASGVTPLTFGTAFIALFLLPELVGLRKNTDALPPLTHVVRLWVSRWMTASVTLGMVVWMAAAWWSQAVHPLVMVTIIAFFYGWLHDHWDTVYDAWAKVQLPGEDVVRVWRVGT